VQVRRMTVAVYHLTGTHYARCCGCCGVLQVCVATGRTIKDEPKLRCRTCKHAMIAAELGDRTSCPLCHSSLQQKQDLGSVGSSAMSRSSSMSSSTSRVSKHVRAIG
jgi:hypothetical protein